MSFYRGENPKIFKKKSHKSMKLVHLFREFTASFLLVLHYFTKTHKSVEILFDLVVPLNFDLVMVMMA